MGVLECASNASTWRGYDYYTERKVVSCEEIRPRVYAAAVQGSGHEPYSVELNLDHPRKSTCSCAFARGRRVICKHMVAVCFTVLPEAAKQYASAAAEEEFREEQDEALYDAVCEYVWKLKKPQLQQALLQLLFDGPEWQFDRFVRESGLEDDW